MKKQEIKEDFIMSKKIEKDTNTYIVSGPAGTYLGQIVNRKGDVVEMENAQLLYYWSGANSLNQLAREGTKDSNSCKFSVECDVTCYGVLRVIKCTQEAVASLRGVAIWRKN